MSSQSPVRFRLLKRPAPALLALIAVCVLLRLIIHTGYAPATYNDTLGYLEIAQQFQALDFSQHTGARVPVFPLLMLGTGLDWETLWLVQSVLGGAISMLLFGVVYHQTQDGRWALLAGLLHTLSLSQLFFEAAVLTETLATFWLVASACLLVCGRHAQWQVFVSMALGLVSALATLTRPLTLLLIPIYAGFLFVRWSREHVRGIQVALRLLGFFTPIAILVGGWCTLNYVTTGTFALTTLTGFSLVGHSGAFIEYAPDEFAVIRDIYLAARIEEIARSGAHTWTIWNAYRDMLQATGLTFAQLSQELARMSLVLFARRPLLYLKGVLFSWVKFWASDNYWNLGLISSPALRETLRWLWRTQRIGLGLCNVAFLILFARQQNRRAAPDPEFQTFVFVLVGLTSLAQALHEFSDNPRFSIPYQSLILCTLALWIWQRTAHRNSQNHTRNRTPIGDAP